MKIALVGATGLVGSVMIKVLEEGKYIPLTSITDFIPVASEKSIGKELKFNNRKYKVVTAAEAIARKPEIALFSAGAATSRELAPLFTGAGCFVIDNSSAWRMEKDIPLVVPEVNGHVITGSQKIIANPNCSTIQLVAVLAPLHRKYGIRRVVVSTYQSVTGTGAKAVQQLQNERQGINGSRVYPHPIDLNIFPHGGTFLPNGYTTEEVKLLEETRKIMQAPEVRITATVVRVPVFGGHSESVNIEFEKPFELDEINKVISSSKGVILQDDTDRAVYPMPKYAEGRDEIFVGRVRRDETIQNGLNMWIVADNLRKGAATNAVQIAGLLIDKEILTF
ncbi:aspartate-semialdehyde dehydrogenase [Lentimicrobium saccharophilum]|uniref:Aspartate-semialdehyde dehydrogenase n=1 Tax=Lentimicrobium saccharophilum TaxID=1678841 RepID=A0A0S7BNI3_9BACT|nr:aspartate-semialdehyde dehydrogenase [Lentimicrobium saccharophilum]GAP41900.1 aspartate-semialdehyde dehydrogenase [Lentimicrobium saccharophilum]